jgi:hypothetical protein
VRARGQQARSEPGAGAAPSRPLSNPALSLPSPPWPAANCTTAFAQQLSAAGVPVDWARLSATLVKPHTVTINLLLAAGFTEGQAGEGRVDRLIAWLGERKNVRAALAAGGLAGGAGAAVSWLQRPEVVLHTAAAAARRGGGGGTGGGGGGTAAIAAGLAVPLGAVVAALGGAVAALVVRRRRQERAACAGAGSGGGAASGFAAAAGDDASEDLSRRQVGGRAPQLFLVGAVRWRVAAAWTRPMPEGQEQRACSPASPLPPRPRLSPPQRRGQQPTGKRRYLAPPLPPGPAGAQQYIEEMAAANLRGAGPSGALPSRTASGASGLSAAALAAARAAGAGAAVDGGGDDVSDGGASEAALRPRLRSLGDSVTSAARFEEDQADGAASDRDLGDEEGGRAAAAAGRPPWALPGAVAAAGDDEDGPALQSRRGRADAAGGAAAGAGVGAPEDGGLPSYRPASH